MCSNCNILDYKVNKEHGMSTISIILLPLLKDCQLFGTQLTVEENIEYIKAKRYCNVHILKLTHIALTKVLSHQAYGISMCIQYQLQVSLS